MPRPKQPRIEQVLDFLSEHGPATALEINDHFGWSAKVALVAITQLRGRYPEQRIRIARYEPRIGSWGPASAVYAIGPGKDVRRPKISKQERAAAALARYRAKFAVEIAAKDRIRKATTRGSTLAVNPWSALVSGGFRGLMTKTADAVQREAA